MGASQTDSRHRILSTRVCVAAPILSRSRSLPLCDKPLPHTGSTAPRHSQQTRLADAHPVFRDAVLLPLTPKHHSHKRSNTHRRHSSLTQQFILLDRKPTETDFEHTPLTCSVSTMPAAVCVSAEIGHPVGQRQLSAPWTAQTLQGATTALYFTPKWPAS